MNSTLRNLLSSALSELLSEPQQQIRNIHSVGGGCIAEAYRIELDAGDQCFAKILPANSDSNVFSVEADGLSALAKSRTLRIPDVLGKGQLADGSQVLFLEWIQPGNPSKDFFREFGTLLASHHRHQTVDWFGWHIDNFIGANPQPNAKRMSWVDFFIEQRIQFQLGLTKKNRVGTDALYRSIDALCDRLDQILGGQDLPASVLHGDLWNGNFLCDEQARPVLIDPAVYYGHREAELAMPLLFGGFPGPFFDAYEEAWALEEEWEDRVEVYKLYHYLNHLNLFGPSYLPDCLAIAKRFTGL